MISELPARLLDVFDEEVDSIVSELRPRREPIRLDWIARKLEVELVDHDFGGTVRGAAIDDRVILLDTAVHGAQRAEVFCHEVSHVLHRRGSFAGLLESKIEVFADQFARELLAPLPWLRAASEPAPLLARKLGVGRALLATQFALLGWAPALMRDRDDVLCAVCGAQSHDRFCRCRSYRFDHWRRRELEDFRDLPEFRQEEDGQLCLIDRATLPDLLRAA